MTAQIGELLEYRGQKLEPLEFYLPHILKERPKEFRWRLSAGTIRKDGFRPFPSYAGY